MNSHIYKIFNIKIVNVIVADLITKGNDLKYRTPN